MMNNLGVLSHKISSHLNVLIYLSKLYVGNLLLNFVNLQHMHVVVVVLVSFLLV